MNRNTKKLVIFTLAVAQILGFIVSAVGLGEKSEYNFRVIWVALCMSLLVSFATASNLFGENPILNSRFNASLTKITTILMSTLTINFFDFNDSNGRTAAAGCTITCVCQYLLLLIYSIMEEQAKRRAGYEVIR
eukprot:TRINITY_DN3822_c0_g1_i1.p1 TRINITY_DN3822_c0_g1~~TRINITY_DN3822_c0_g1_i1.p1  ORF type:complete len:134 (-),score=19.17 TRINITY_DN3822_c0_g1_i1:136-537(-)